LKALRSSIYDTVFWKLIQGRCSREQREGIREEGGMLTVSSCGGIVEERQYIACFVGMGGRVLKASNDKYFIHGGIFLLSNKMQAVGDRITGEITTKQWFLLLFIRGMDEALPSITEIAKQMDSTRQNVTQMLRVLEKNGFVSLSVIPEDKRSVGVSLKEKAYEMLDEISKTGAHFIQRLFEGISESETACAAGVLRKLFENLEEMEEEI
jgi:DNA-binding MarR family transcriptional regulator